MRAAPAPIAASADTARTVRRSQCPMAGEALYESCAHVTLTMTTTAPRWMISAEKGKSMLIVSYKPGHDGAFAILDDGMLVACIEAEKDSYPRYDTLGPTHFIDSLSRMRRPPDAICVGGWPKGFHSVERPLGAGYYGSEDQRVLVTRQSVLGRDTPVFWSTHERSHIYCAYGLSPYADVADCYCLVWEGNLGNFYRISRSGKITAFPQTLIDPGNKYAFLYSVADPGFPDVKGKLRLEDAGKLMALAAYGAPGQPTGTEEAVIRWVLAQNDGIVLNHRKGELADTPYFNVGVTSPAFCQLARRFSDALFAAFQNFAKEHLTERLPLVIAGGCGLNCDWNEKWRRSDMFPDIFVAPCANDSGSALGTAIDAQHYFTGKCAVHWSVYAGPEFQVDMKLAPGPHEEVALDYEEVARDLLRGEVVAIVQGRCEIGPRALGNRSLLAEPYSEATRSRLNTIKQREPFRPIAPVVLEEDMSRHFAGHVPSPYMLEFARVINPRLKAVTHVDGSARPQSVNEAQNPRLCEILKAFRVRAGDGVLCNTSLNYRGRGFINRSSDLIEYCVATGIRRAVVGDRYVRIAEKVASAETVWETDACNRVEGRSRPDLVTSYEAPLGAVEAAIAELWEEALGIGGIGRNDSFFDLGGHSIAAAQIVGSVRERFEVPLRMDQLFTHASVAGIAQVVDAALARRVEEMSEEEVRSCLAQNR